MNTLSADTLAHIISHIKDTRCILAVRGTCKNLLAACPLDKIIGIDKKTAEWLLTNNPPERWLKPAMRGEKFTVCIHERSITIYTQDGPFRNKSESHHPLAKKYMFPTVQDHRCILAISRDGSICTLSIMHIMDEDEDEKVVSDAGDGVCAFCEMPGTVFMATAGGVVYSLSLHQPPAGICHDFKTKKDQIQNKTAKHFDFDSVNRQCPEPIHITKISTNDGSNFIYLLNQTTIVQCTPNQPPVVIKSDRTIKDFWIIHRDAIVCWVDDGGLKLLHIPSRCFVATLPLQCDSAVVIHIMPSLQSVWLLDNSMRLHRSGGAMIPRQTTDQTQVKTLTFYRNRSSKLVRKLREVRMANSQMAMRLEALQAQYDALNTKK